MISNYNREKFQSVDNEDWVNTYTGKHVEKRTKVEGRTDEEALRSRARRRYPIHSLITSAGKVKLVY